MSITQNGSGQIVYSAPPTRRRSEDTGTVVDQEFAICDQTNVLKQIQFEIIPLSPVKGTLTLQASIAGDATLDLTGLTPGAINSFAIIQPDVGTSPTADSVADTLTLTSTGGSITVTGTASTDTIDFVVNTANISFALGAVATPSIKFTGDTNTGMWSPAADTLAFSNGGVETLRINSAGRVLVNTAQTNGVVVIKALSDDYTDGLTLEGAGSGGNRKWNFFPSVSGYFYIRNQDQAVNAITLSNIGLVGVSVGSPTSPLHVAGDSNNTSPASFTSGGCSMLLRNSNGTNNSFSFFGFENSMTAYDSAIVGVHENQNTSATATGHLEFLTRNAGTVGERLRIKADGRLAFKTSANETTGAGTAVLGANSPAVTLTAPYKWLTVELSDASVGYIPVWK